MARTTKQLLITQKYWIVTDEQDGKTKHELWSEDQPHAPHAMVIAHRGYKTGSPYITFTAGTAFDNEMAAAMAEAWGMARHSMINYERERAAE